MSRWVMWPAHVLGAPKRVRWTRPRDICTCAKLDHVTRWISWPCINNTTVWKLRWSLRIFTHCVYCTCPPLCLFVFIIYYSPSPWLFIFPHPAFCVLFTISTRKHMSTCKQPGSRFDQIWSGLKSLSELVSVVYHIKSPLLNCVTIISLLYHYHSKQTPRVPVLNTPPLL